MADSWDAYQITNNGGGSYTLGANSGANATSDVLTSADQAGNLVFSTTGDTQISDPTLGFGTGTYEGSVSIGGHTGYVVSYRSGTIEMVFFASGTNVSAGGTGTLATSASFNAACFVAGTMIRTPDGDRAVEDLRAGDLVLTADGVAKPVLWLGHSTVSTLFTDPARTLPVRIKAGALGENLPARDLLVSAGHAMLIEGVLAQAGALVNGTSIARDTGVAATFTYYHVELAGHDVLLAEGAATESFLIGVDDLTFDNWAERPAGAAVPAEMAYPRVKSARQMPASVRGLLAARAAVIAPEMAVAA